MSKNRNTILSLAGRDFENLSIDELIQNFSMTLRKGIHGISFCPYLEYQGPGTQLTEAQIIDRLTIIEPHVSWIRSFSCTDGNEMIPVLGKKLGLKTMVGAWIDDDLESNEEEIEALLKIARNGDADILAIGNEILLREELKEEEIINYIQRVKKEVPHIPVAYVDAYYKFENHPALADACDILLCNCYPFWEGCSLEYSLLYMKDMYNRAQRAAKGKKVIIAETGWPDKGQNFHGAIPSEENALKYFLNTQKWAEEENIEIFYFSSFNENWKNDDEGDVGSSWGLWDAQGKIKYGCEL